MNFNIYNIFIIAGVIQGFIFTLVVLFNKKYRAKSTLFLLSLIFIYSVGNLAYILPDVGVMSLTKMYNTLFFPFASIIPVVIYFYVTFFLNPAKKLQFIDKLLFLPFCVFLILTLFFRFKYFLGSREDVLHPVFVKVIHFNETFSVLYSIVLLIIVLKRIQLVQKQYKVFNPQIIQSDLKWLFITMSVILFFTFYWAYLTYLNIFTNHVDEISFYLLWVVVASLIYWLGHVGIYKYGLISERTKIRQSITNNRPLVDPNLVYAASETKSRNQHIERLENLLANEKKYLDSNLTLESVSEQLQLSPSYLSKIINSEMKTSFPEYLNKFSVEEAKIYLKNSDFSNYTITSIGLEAGFNSKSAFYEVFKKATGQTPLSFKKKSLG